MAKKRAGWERILYYGTAGSAASTLMPNVTDCDVNATAEFNETTDRGDGTALPKNTEQVVARGVDISFTLIYEDSEATISAMIAAAVAGTAVALKTVRLNGGSTEFDGDVYLEMTSPGPLKGGQELQFTAHPTDDAGRDWTLA